MRYYSSKLRGIMSRANNFLWFIHEVAIEPLFQKSLTQEGFKSGMKFRYQILFFVMVLD